MPVPRLDGVFGTASPPFCHQQRIRTRAEGQLFNALRNAANVKDERSKFY